MADTLITGTTLIEDKRSAQGTIWSCTGHNFHADTETADVAWGATAGIFTANATISDIMAPVFLPNGVKVTKVIVYGNDTGNTWNLNQLSLNSSAPVRTIMATAAIDTEDTTITEELINNNNNSYGFNIAGMEAGDIIYGARIIYE